MDTALLVDSTIAAGRRLIDLFDRNDYPYTALLWFYDPDPQRYLLLLATPLVDRVGLFTTYLQLGDLVGRPRAETEVDTTDMSVVSPEWSALTKGFQAIVDRGYDLTDRRYRTTMVGGVYVHDAYIYRVLGTAAAAELTAKVAANVPAQGTKPKTGRNGARAGAGRRRVAAKS